MHKTRSANEIKVIRCFMLTKKEIDECYMALVDAIVDIDEGDTDDPQSCVEYANEIMHHLRAQELTDSIHHLYLQSVDTTLTEKDRFDAVELIFAVSTKMRLLTETIFLAVALFDCCASTGMAALGFADKGEKYLLMSTAVACLWIANKYEENDAEWLRDFICLSKESAHNIEDDVNIYYLSEIAILKTVNYRLTRTHPLVFLRRYSKASWSDTKTHTLSKYISECSVTDTCMLFYLPSCIAAAAVFIARAMQPDVFKQCWSATLVHYTHYSPGLDVTLQECILELNRILHKQASRHYVCWTKYADTRHLGVSKMTLMSREDILDLFKTL